MEKENRPAAAFVDFDWDWRDRDLVHECPQWRPGGSENSADVALVGGMETASFWRPLKSRSEARSRD
jgi:hypothetical protein